MKDSELNKIAAERGWRTGDTKATFRRGYTGACNGNTREGHMLKDKRMIAAWQAGFDYRAEEQTPLSLGKHVVENVDVALTKAKGRGFEVTIPIKGGTNVVFGETAVIALSAARDRINAAAQEFRRVPDVEVDAQRAQLVKDNGKTPPQLPMRSPAECAAEVHRCMTELAKREATEETAKTARKAAENALASANRALLDAVDRDLKPALPIGAA